MWLGWASNLIWFFEGADILIWATTRQNLPLGFGEQQRRRPACAFAQSDQCLCDSLIGNYHIKTCSKRNFTFLVSLCSWAVLILYDLIGNPVDRFCRAEAHILDELRINMTIWCIISNLANLGRQSNLVYGSLVSASLSPTTQISTAAGGNFETFFFTFRIKLDFSCKLSTDASHVFQALCG